MGNLYIQNASAIFKKKGSFPGFGGIFSETYGHEGLEKLLKEYFGDTPLSGSLTNLLITAYDIEKRKPFYFKSRLAREEPETENFLLRDICRSTSAAPTYFEPNQIPWAGADHLALIDGGVFANNPSMLAYTEAVNLARLRKSAPEAHNTREMTADIKHIALPDEAPEYFMLSLGTGRVMRPYPIKDACDWGAVGWLRPLIDILMQGVSETVDFQMQYILPQGLDGSRHYVRINPFIPEANSDMANVSAENMAALQEIARQSVQQNLALIDQVCEALVN